MENKYLNFLRNFPAWIVLTPLLVMFVIFYNLTGDAAYKDWISWVLSALFTSLGMQRFTLPSYYPTSRNTVSTESGNIEITPTPTDINTPIFHGEEDAR